MIYSYRRKIRNCIRKDTYRYYFKKNNIYKIWCDIENEFGKAEDWKDFNMFVIENDKFIIRKAKDEESFTFIKKKGFDIHDEEQFHNLVKLGK